MFKRQPRKTARNRKGPFHCEWCGELLSSESKHYLCPYKHGTDAQFEEDEAHDSESANAARSDK